MFTLLSRAQRSDLTRRVIPSEARNLRMLRDNHEIATTSSMSRNDCVGLPRTLRVLAMKGASRTSIPIGNFWF
jgi:hypothetical protein